jgi:hypothetical protein
VELHEFPRPPQDNGRGVHWSISPYEWGKRDWGFWTEQLLAMKIKWVKIMDDGGGSALSLARRLVDLNIMPVVRFYRSQQNPGNIGQRGRDAAKRYIQLGAVYFETNNEPDLDLEWRGGKKPSNWLDIVVGDFIADADMILAEGGFPAVPAFGVGTLRDPFAAIVESGRRDILDGGVWAALHNYCLARPLEYPNDPVNLHGEPITEEEWHAAGGAWAWEMGWETVNQRRKELANPKANIMSDATCFRAFEQLNAYIVRAAGHPIPVMMTEGGYNVAQRAGSTAGDDPRYPKPTPQATSELNLEMFKYMQGDREILGQKVPDCFFAAMPWLIAAQRIGVQAPPAENQGPWFTHKYDAEWRLNGELPLVQMLKDLPSHVRQDGPLPPQWRRPPTPDKLGRTWDPRLNYLGKGIRLEPAAGAPGMSISAAGSQVSGRYWKLVDAKWLDKEEARGTGYIFVKALDLNGKPLENATFVVSRPGAQDPVKTKGAIDGYWGNYAMYGLLGTYSVEMKEGGHPSERVAGVGLGMEELPEAWASTAFRLTFQLVDEARPKPKPEAPSETVVETPRPEAGPGAGASAGAVTDAEEKTQPLAATEDLADLHQALLQAAQARAIPLDRSTPFYNYAREHNLGERLSDEFSLEHEEREYVAQVFERGVVYAPVKQRSQIAHIDYKG